MGSDEGAATIRGRDAVRSNANRTVCSAVTRSSVAYLENPHRVGSSMAGIGWYWLVLQWACDDGLGPVEMVPALPPRLKLEREVLYTSRTPLRIFRSSAFFVERSCTNRLKSHFRRRGPPVGAGISIQAIEHLESV